MDADKEELKRKKQEARSQIKDLKRQQKENKKQIRQIKTDSEPSQGTFGLTVLIVLFLLALLFLLVKFDVGGFGSNVLGPVIGDVPYINKILPASAQDDTLLANKKHTSKKKKDKKQQAATEAATTTETATTQAATAGASGTSGNAAASTQALDPTMQTYVDTYNSMEASSAAAILEGMTGDYTLVAEIMSHLDPQKRADIFAAMSTQNAAKIMKIMQRF